VIPFIRLLETVREVADEHPDKTHDAGLYWDYQHQCPACLIGHAMHRLGVNPPDRMFNSQEVHDVNWAKMGFDLITGPQLYWLRLVQFFADSGHNWSGAVERADEMFPLRRPVAA
jgi:hypothetical protein